MNQALAYRVRIGVLAMLALTAALYWPGLGGSYLFDDFPNIVDNDAVHVTSLHWQDWRHAADASPSHELPRPMAMLSYAANYYFTGVDPWPMKFTNLLIHLANGALLYAVLRLLLSLWSRRRGDHLPQATIAISAVGLSFAWLVCPINLSSVLYVVQRMESLAQTFVLLGLLIYLHGRRRMLDGGGGAAWCAAGLALGSVCGILCKETASLLPLYAFLIELTVLRFEATDRSGHRKLWALYTVLLFLPGILGLTWLLPHTVSSGAYAGRSFTLAQRLFTELRIVADYIAWTLLPHPSDLGFYHDDIELSRGWLSPPSTLGSGLLIAVLLMSAAAVRRRMPLYSLGIGWYIAAHLLTATIIPLELVFEHRNYFASIGLVLAAAALILEIPPKFSLIGRAVTILALALFCCVTALRAQEWGNTIRFAFAEAQEHPNSPRANYELGRTLTIVSGYRADSKLIAPAMQAFERAAALPASDASASAGLIIVASHTHSEIKPEWWQTLTEKLSSQPPTQQDIGALQSLADCQHKGECANQTSQLLSAFLAALNHPPPSARLLATYGAFAANQLGDYQLAASALGDAVSLSPDNTGYRIDLAKVLVLGGRLSEASEAISRLDPEKLDPAAARQVDTLKRQLP